MRRFSNKPAQIACNTKYYHVNTKVCIHKSYFCMPLIKKELSEVSFIEIIVSSSGKESQMQLLR